jgi:hypothetical protein
MSITLPMLAGAQDDGRNALKWATDYFLKAHTATNDLYGQMGQGMWTTPSVDVQKT